MAYFLINAYGKDRTGIVRDVSKVLYELGFNLEDSTMAKLADEFTIMLIVEGDKTLEEIKDAFKPLNESGLTVNIKQVEKPEEKEKNLFKLVVYGADKPGIVYNVSDVLSKKGINITDMTTQKSGELYILLTDVEVPDNITEEELYKEIEDLKEQLGIDMNLEKIETVEM